MISERSVRPPASRKAAPHAAPRRSSDSDRREIVVEGEAGRSHGPTPSTALTSLGAVAAASRPSFAAPRVQISLSACPDDALRSRAGGPSYRLGLEALESVHAAVCRGWGWTR